MVMKCESTAILLEEEGAVKCNAVSVAKGGDFIFAAGLDEILAKLSHILHPHILAPRVLQSFQLLAVCIFT